MIDITAPRNLNPHRRHRSFPRVVKRARRNSYRVKTAADLGTRHDRPPTIKIATTSRSGVLINSS